MPNQNPFFARLTQDSRPPLGTWLMSGAPGTAEALALCGFDFLVLDMEHVPIDVPEAVEILRTLAGTPAIPVVRPHWSEQVIIKRVLDAGAETLMLPFIESAEAARQAVRFTRYPPEGIRGVAAVHRASGFGQKKDYFATAAERLCVIAQLESPGAVAHLEEIAAVPGIDALFLGPSDLSAAMGHIGDAGHQDVQDVIADVARRAKAVGKPVGIVGPNPDMVRRYLDYGYSFAAVASDIALMTGRAGEFLSALRKELPPTPSSAPY